MLRNELQEQKNRQESEFIEFKKEIKTKYPIRKNIPSFVEEKEEQFLEKQNKQ